MESIQQIQPLDQLDSKLSKKDPKLWKAVKDFESILIYQMIKSMRESIMKSDLTEESPGKDYFTSMFDEEVAKSISQRQNDQLAEILYQQLVTETIQHQQEQNTNKTQFHTLRNYSQHNVFHKVNHYQNLIHDAAQQFNLDKNLVKAVITQESGGNPNTISSKGAKGLMQLMDRTAEEMNVEDVMNPRDNIFGGTRYLSFLLKQFNGNLSKALAGYNAGPSAVNKYNGIPPYKETQNYVKRVLAYYKVLKENEVQ